MKCSTQKNYQRIFTGKYQDISSVYDHEYSIIQTGKKRTPTPSMVILLRPPPPPLCALNI